MSLDHARLLALVEYDPATGFFTARAAVKRPGVRPGRPLGHVESNGYRRIMIDRSRYLAHRLAWFYVNGEWPILTLDHINLNPSDNRIKNLRQATHSQNHANTRPPKSNTSGLKGVTWNRFKNYWQAAIIVNGKCYFLGGYKTKEEGHAAYVAAAVKFHGEFARAS